LIATACLLTALVLVLGSAVWLSRSALPGDVLYGVKRASENTELALAGSTTEKGKLKLQFAGNRIGEVGKLIPGTGALALGPGLVADGALSAHTAGLIEQTLASADDDIRAAAQMLGDVAVSSGSPDTLDALIAWAPPQLHAMHAIALRLPNGATRGAAVATWQLIRDARARAVQLEADLGCGCLTRSGSDELGPRPCTHPCANPHAPGTPGRSGVSSGPSSAPRSGNGGQPTGQPTTQPGAPGGPGNPQVTYPGGPARPGGPRGASPVGPGGGPSSRGPGPPGGGQPVKITSPHGSAPPSTRGAGPGQSGTPTPTPTPRSTPPSSRTSGASGLPTPSGSANSCGVTLGLGPIGIGIGIC
jgi:hypothetical protein